MEPDEDGQQNLRETVHEREGGEEGEHGFEGRPGLAQGFARARPHIGQVIIRRRFARRQFNARRAHAHAKEIGRAVKPGVSGLEFRFECHSEIGAGDGGPFRIEYALIVPCAAFRQFEPGGRAIGVRALPAPYDILAAALLDVLRADVGSPVQGEGGFFAIKSQQARLIAKIDIDYAHPQQVRVLLEVEMLLHPGISGHFDLKRQRIGRLRLDKVPAAIIEFIAQCWIAEQQCERIYRFGVVQDGGLGHKLNRIGAVLAQQNGCAF